MSASHICALQAQDLSEAPELESIKLFWQCLLEIDSFQAIQHFVVDDRIVNV